MDKIITLCFDCRKILKDHYRVDTYEDGAKPGKSCQNCGEKFDLRVCRIRTKPEKERGKL